jgi:hypothetical protein
MLEMKESAGVLAQCSVLVHFGGIGGELSNVDRRFFIKKAKAEGTVKNRKDHPPFNFRKPLAY